MCIPSVDRLDVYIRQYRLRYLLITREMAWENNSTRRRGYVEVKFPRGVGHWSTIGYARFPIMDPAVKKEYEEVKMSYQQQKISELQAKADTEKRGRDDVAKDKRRIRALLLFAHENSNLTHVNLAAMTGYSKDRIKDLLPQVRVDREREGKD